VSLAEGRSKLVGQLRRGDILDNGARVECVIISHYRGSLVVFGSGQSTLAITPYHPVLVENQWSFPVDVDGARIVNVEDESVLVCNLILDREHTVSVGGIRCVTLAHGFEHNDVVKHSYYGTSRIVDDLKQLKGWDQGLIVLKEFKVSRDEKGVVNRSYDHKCQIDAF
jgi:hypothetical protein